MVSKREKPDKDSQAASVKKRAGVKSASKNREKLHDDLENKKHSTLEFKVLWVKRNVI